MKFEYEVFHESSIYYRRERRDTVESALTGRGRQGWELVAVVGLPENQVFYFKRAIKK